MTTSTPNHSAPPNEILYAAMKVGAATNAPFDVADDDWPRVLAWMEEDPGWATLPNLRALAALAPRRIADVNLGDSGTLFVFADRALVQCF